MNTVFFSFFETDFIEALIAFVLPLEPKLITLYKNFFALAENMVLNTKKIDVEFLIVFIMSYLYSKVDLLVTPF